MQGHIRKIVQAILYETIAIVVLSPCISLIYDKSLAQAGTLSLILSVSALVWSMLFNYAFEYWETRQPRRARTFSRRLLHSLGFEGGLVLLLVPLVAWWLNITWWAALVTDLGLFAFFFCYALGFQWVFDKLFDVPESAQDVNVPSGKSPCTSQADVR